MDMDNQAAIKKIVEDKGKDNLIVILGNGDPDGAEMTAKTVTEGDPSYAGPLAGVQLNLPVYHILESEIKKDIPEEIYEKQVGMMELVLDTEKFENLMKQYRN